MKDFRISVVSHVYDGDRNPFSRLVLCLSLSSDRQVGKEDPAWNSQLLTVENRVVLSL